MGVQSSYVHKESIIYSWSSTIACYEIVCEKTAIWISFEHYYLSNDKLSCIQKMTPPQKGLFLGVILFFVASFFSDANLRINVTQLRDVSLLLLQGMQ